MTYYYIEERFIMTRPLAQSRTGPAQRGARGGAGRTTANRGEHAMSEISNLLQSAEAARESHNRATEQQSRSRKHLTSLIDINEENLREKRVELTQNEIERECMVREYEQLRDMQHSLMMALEFGRVDGLGDLAARSSAEMAAGTHVGPMALDTATNDDAPSPDGPSENGSGKKESDRNGEDDMSDLRSGFQRVIRRSRSPRTKAGGQEETKAAS